MVLRAGNSIDSVGTGPAELLGVRISPRLHARAPADLPPRRRGGWASPPARGSTSSTSPARRATGSSATPPSSSSGGSTRRGRRAQKAQARPEGQLLPARPRAHPARAARSPRSRVYPAATRAAHAQGHARHLGRLVGRLPAHLPRAVDRRDRPARLLRLRAHRRSAQRDLRVERAQQLRVRSPSGCRSGRARSAARGARRRTAADRRAEPARTTYRGTQQAAGSGGASGLGSASASGRSAPRPPAAPRRRAARGRACGLVAGVAWSRPSCGFASSARSHRSTVLARRRRDGVTGRG